MKSKLYCKILAIGVICLFIGMGIHPAFAITINTPSSENENPITKTTEIYENTNCFVIGMSSSTRILPWGTYLPYIKGNLHFGYIIYLERSESAKGLIYTSNVVKKWVHNGYFKGALGSVEYLIDFYVYTGIEGFRGLGFGGLTYPYSNLIYFGFADKVKIKICYN